MSEEIEVVNSGYPDDKFFTPAHIQLQEMASRNWPDFCRLIGDDCLLKAITCILHAKGLSMRRIADKYKDNGLTKRKVQLAVENKCNCK